MCIRDSLYVTNAAVADEVVQDTWLGVIRGIWAFEGRSSLKTWIFRILVNRARTRAVRETRSARLAAPPFTEQATEPLSAESPEPSLLGQDPGASPERSLLTKELREKLVAVIDALPSNLRVVLWL